MGVDHGNGSKKKSKYNYTFGDEFPGTSTKRKLFNLPKGLPVPAEMGWLWNAQDVPGSKPQPRGWKPGGIRKSVREKMIFKTVSKTGVAKKKKKKKLTATGGHLSEDSESENMPVPKVALKVHRKGDEFTIQVQPLKDLTEISPIEDPFVDCEPLTFRIIKKRSPEEQERVEARKMAKLKKMRDDEIRKALAEATEDICKCAYMDVYCNDLTAIDSVIKACPAFPDPVCLCQSESLSSLSSDASWDIEYTPPFGCYDMAQKKKMHFIHVDTQYIPADAGIEEAVYCKKSSTKVPKYKKPMRKGCRCH